MITPEPQDLPGECRFSGRDPETHQPLSYRLWLDARDHFEHGHQSGLVALRTHRAVLRPQQDALAQAIQVECTTPPNDAPLDWKPLHPALLAARIAGFRRACWDYNRQQAARAAKIQSNHTARPGIAEGDAGQQPIH